MATDAGQIVDILTNSLSPDANLRNAAETALQNAEQHDFSNYLLTLMQVLYTDQAPDHVRVAAGLALKNAFTARVYSRQAALHAKWVSQTAQETKTRVKEMALATLGSPKTQIGNAAAQVVVAIASIELPRQEWNELMPTLVRGVSEGASATQKQASLTTIGFICEVQDSDLRAALVSHSNAILTAVVQGARPQEPSADVRLAAMTALGDSLEFVSTNFKHEGERNYIMQVVCEATQSDDPRIQQGAFGCLNRIMALYYDNMRFYMEKALFGLTILGMKNADEDVAKLAVEFWSTVCEEEISIEEENAQTDSPEEMRPFYNFARVATHEVVPVLLELLLKNDEDAADDEYNIARAAYQCLQLYAQTVTSAIIPPVISFVEANLRSDDWHRRDAAVSAFGAMMDGPEEKVLEPIIKSGIQPLIGMMADPSLQVRDSTAYTLGRVTEACPDAIDPAQHLDPLLQSLFAGLMSSSKMGPSCCWALMNLAERFGGSPETPRNLITPHFNQSVENLLVLTGQLDKESSVRTAAYEVLGVFIRTAALDSLPAVAELLNVILERLRATIPMQGQVVSVEDKITLEDLQTSLCNVLHGITQRLEKEVASQGNSIMDVLLQILNAVRSKSSVPEAILTAISGLATAMEEDFVVYMDAFSPYLFNALGNEEEPGLCAMAVGLVSDITRSLGERSQPYCDNFMNYLLNNLRSTALSNQFKPAILQCFGDIAGAIGGAFETYLSVVAQVLQQAASITTSPEGSYEMFDYVVSLREGIMDAWGGIIGAMKSSGKNQALQPYVESILTLLNAIATDMNRSEPLMRAAMGVIGDLADAFPNGELADAFRQEWLAALIRETKSNRDFGDRTRGTARWAREQVKRQTGGTAGVLPS